MSKKVINQVYLDMDGVLTNFDVETVRELQDKGEWKDKGFPTFVKKKGFEHLGMLGDAKLLVHYLQNTGVKISILSSAGSAGSMYPEVVKQKKEWLKKHGLDFPTIIVEHKEMKKDYAKKHALLIDDTKQNCKDFKEAGGRAICHKDALNTIEKLSKKYVLVGKKKDD